MNLGGIKVSSGEALALPVVRQEQEWYCQSACSMHHALVLAGRHMVDHCGAKHSPEFVRHTRPPHCAWVPLTCSIAVELERACIEGVDGVVEAAAVGCPTPGGGPDQLHLFLVLRPGLAVPTPAELQRRCQQAVSSKLNPLFKASPCKHSSCMKSMVALSNHPI